MYGVEDTLLYHFYFKALPLLFLNLVFLSQNIGLVVVKHLLKPIVLTTHDETVPTFMFMLASVHTFFVVLKQFARSGPTGREEFERAKNSVGILYSGIFTSELVLF